MTNRGTVRNKLTQGEALEFGATVMQQLGSNIDPDKARYYIRHKSELGKALRKLGIHQMPEFDTAEWERLYAKHFGLVSLDLSGIHVPAKPEYPCRAIVVLPQLSNNQVFDACTKAFKTWRYVDDLDTIRDTAKRPQGPYAVWVRDVVEADEDMADKSANDIETAGIDTMTLKERMVLELKYFDETGKHLDIDNVTLCSGSRLSFGFVPLARWSDGKFCVNWFPPSYRSPILRSRVAVS